MEKYKIINLEKQYWGEMVAIYENSIKTGVTTFQRTVPSYEDWIDSHLEDSNIILLEDGEVLGFAALAAMNSKIQYSGVAELSIYVKSGQRGKGIGTKLLNELVRISEEVGIWTLQATVLEDNIGSKKLHEKCGFREVGYREKIARTIFGVWKDTFLMERRSDIGIADVIDLNVIMETEANNFMIENEVMLEA
ncbi:GNAT family N-acetyltransferase [uncultured Clostridium sp.]|uniref:GNAT family N-acetyltransferase n=1 Tax=uncultured Clostridium sp. TaxID=59620 RepID=UPI0026356325|nr:GNAT family N-acetyltransferase [uncultured Clostridium sp.]